MCLVVQHQRHGDKKLQSLWRGAGLLITWMTVTEDFKKGWGYEPTMKEEELSFIWFYNYYMKGRHGGCSVLSSLTHTLICRDESHKKWDSVQSEGDGTDFFLFFYRKKKKSNIKNISQKNVHIFRCWVWQWGIIFSHKQVLASATFSASLVKFSSWNLDFLEFFSSAQRLCFLH